MSVGMGYALPESGKRETRWLTPKHIVDALGHFDLDPCGAPGYELAQKTFQIDDGEDGLALPWAGRVWLNPPYGKESVPFLHKLAYHDGGGDCFYICSNRYANVF